MRRPINKCRYKQLDEETERTCTLHDPKILRILKSFFLSRTSAIVRGMATSCPRPASCVRSSNYYLRETRYEQEMNNSKDGNTYLPLFPVCHVMRLYLYLNLLGSQQHDVGSRLNSSHVTGDYQSSLIDCGSSPRGSKSGLIIR